jgi:transcriptional regulator with XRE-family HTH domain
VEDETGSTGAIALVRRRIGAEFEELRKQAGMTQEQAAAALQRSRMTLVRIEDGDMRIRFRDSDVAAMLDLYEASPEKRELLRALTSETRNGRKPWWQDYISSAFPLFRVYIGLEDGAQTIRKYESEVIHGLLQTRAYAYEINNVLAGHWTPTEIEQKVNLRMERQALLTRPRAPHLIAVLHEGALRTLVGGPDLMAEQLQHLLHVSEQANISLRVIPFAAGVHGGMTASGAFTMLDFPADLNGAPSHPPLVYLDNLTGANHLTRPAEITPYQLVWDHLTQRALDEDSSRETITAILEGLPR